MDNKREYFYGLNLLRFLMALAIVVYHYRLIFFGATPFADNPIIKYCYLHGYLSVEVFFAISGFVLYWNYAHKLRPINTANFAKNVDGGGARFLSFLLGRIIRIYPLMILTVLFAAASIWLSTYFFPNGHLIQANWAVNKLRPTLIAFIMNVLGIHSGLAGNQDTVAILGSSWFLSVLMICYVIFYVILRKCNGDKIIENSLFFVMILLGIFLYINGGFNFPLLYVCCGRGYVNFFLGILLAQIITLLDNNKKVFCAIAFSLFLICLFILCYNLEYLGNFGLAVSLTICPALIVLFALSKIVNYISKSRLISFLGDISFGIYLWHLVLSMSFYFIQDLFVLEAEYSNKKFFIAFIIITIAVAAITYIFYEKSVTGWCKTRLCKYLNATK